VDFRAGLDDLEKRKFLTLPGLELRPLGQKIIVAKSKVVKTGWPNLDRSNENLLKKAVVQIGLLLPMHVTIQVYTMLSMCAYMFTSCSDKKKIRAGFDMSDRAIPL
jgi:hypothetical protein